jgi:RsiW-degrading membrane proteinase PrsW (M82 family)
VHIIFYTTVTFYSVSHINVPTEIVVFVLSDFSVRLLNIFISKHISEKRSKLNSFSCTEYRSDYLFFGSNKKKKPIWRLTGYFFYRFLGILLAILFLYTVVVEQNFSQLQWCYLFPIFVAFALKSDESIIWSILFFIGLAVRSPFQKSYQGNEASHPLYGDSI